MKKSSGLVKTDRHDQKNSDNEWKEYYGYCFIQYFEIAQARELFWKLCWEKHLPNGGKQSVQDNSR